MPLLVNLRQSGGVPAQMPDRTCQITCVPMYTPVYRPRANRCPLRRSRDPAVEDVRVLFANGVEKDEENNTEALCRQRDGGAWSVGHCT